MRGERDCYSCKYSTYGGSNSTAGGHEAQGFGQEGCTLPLLVESYSLCEPLAILVEQMMISQAETEAGCPWKAAAVTPVHVADHREWWLSRVKLGKLCTCNDWLSYKCVTCGGTCGGTCGCHWVNDEGQATKAEGLPAEDAERLRKNLDDLIKGIQSNDGGKAIEEFQDVRGGGCAICMGKEPCGSCGFGMETVPSGLNSQSILEEINRRIDSKWVSFSLNDERMRVEINELERLAGWIEARDA